MLELVARGKSNKEIAAALAIAENTVKNHLKNILEKLHLENRVQAATYALREGLVDEAARRPSLSLVPPKGPCRHGPSSSRALAREGDGPTRSARVGCGWFRRMPPIRVLLADDHALFRQGVASLLAAESDFEVVGEAVDGQQALEMARELMPDVILMDVSMPVMDGLEATRRIKAEMPARQDRHPHGVRRRAQPLRGRPVRCRGIPPEEDRAAGALRHAAGGRPGRGSRVAG